MIEHFGACLVVQEFFQKENGFYTNGEPSSKMDKFSTMHGLEVPKGLASFFDGGCCPIRSYSKFHLARTLITLP